MKVRMPKSFLSLPQREKDLINEVLTEEVQKQVDKNYAELQKLWLQFACIILNKSFGFGKERLLLFLGAWREMYRYNNKIPNKSEQTAFLTEELDRIFGVGGYPSKYIDKLEEMR